jgi:predicted adenylyl cyclase CyaB
LEGVIGMPVEIEWKVRLSDEEVASMRQNIAVLFQDATVGEVRKDDTYYGRTCGGEALFRIRGKRDSLVITRKVKELREDGIEVNQEIELELPLVQAQSADAFFTSLGYVPVVTKRKRGSAWTVSGLTIELIHVEQLGWFVEVEALVPSDAGEARKSDAIARLAAVRTQLGLDGHPLESRYYIEMLQDIGNKMER